MSRIAIIDTAVDPNSVKVGTFVEYINLCGDDSHGHEFGHGTVCAMVLDHCASDYELVNIRIFKENGSKVYGQIELLAEALKLCGELKIDIVSLSAVSSLLSDSRFLYDITRDLADDTIIVSALDNKRFMTVPTCYHHVIGVRSDVAGALSTGELAYSANDPFNANVIANCSFAFLQPQQRFSNSFAVPVVAAYVNKLINLGHSKQNIEAMLRDLKPYPSNKQYESLLLTNPTPARDVPVVFISCSGRFDLSALMDRLFDDFEVQATALSLDEYPYDARIKNAADIDTIEHDLRSMKWRYKTDLIFIFGKQNMREKVLRSIKIDVEVIGHENSEMMIICEDKREVVPYADLADRLHEILTV